MTAFASEAALADFMRDLARARAARYPVAPVETVTVTAARVEGITNVQHEGADEGGIVKLAGDYLVMLRRGRLFTVRVGGNAFEAAGAAEAYGPDIDPRQAWYDEMLVADGRIVVVGYSYERGGTELGLFDLQKDGFIRYRDTYHLGSADYYSPLNYASRLVGGKLVFYSPLFLEPTEAQPLQGLPALRRWRSDPDPGKFRPIYSARRIYPPLVASSAPTLHTVTACDLDRPELRCQSTGVIGPPGREFYVSANAVYVWATEWADVGRPEAALTSQLYRLPLDDSGPPGALRVQGTPIDQFSFLEDENHLNVHVRASSGINGWRSGGTEGDTALLRVPLSAFADDVAAAEPRWYRPLPRLEDDVWLQNRFVGAYLLYATSYGGWEGAERADATLVAYRYADGGEPWTLRLGHAVERIELLGDDAVAVGPNDRDLHFSVMALGDVPSVADDFVRRDAAQGESRSHGFFYRVRGEGAGLLGLPIHGPGRPRWDNLFEDSASVLFLSNSNRVLRELGQLAPSLERVSDDGCAASCVDWYGNARPIFLGDRLLALLGYELVEGEIADSRLVERRRLSFAPVRR